MRTHRTCYRGHEVTPENGRLRINRAGCAWLECIECRRLSAKACSEKRRRQAPPKEPKVKRPGRNRKFRRALSLSTRGFLRASKLAAVDGGSRSGVMEQLLALACEARGIEVTDAEVRAYQASVREKRADVAEESERLLAAAFGVRAFSG